MKCKNKYAIMLGGVIEPKLILVVDMCHTQTAAQSQKIGDC
jgi:hypothetical protein